MVVVVNYLLSPQLTSLNRLRVKAKLFSVRQQRFCPWGKGGGGEGGGHGTRTNFKKCVQRSLKKVTEVPFKAQLTSLDHLKAEAGLLLFSGHGPGVSSVEGGGHISIPQALEGIIHLRECMEKFVERGEGEGGGEGSNTAAGIERSRVRIPSDSCGFFCLDRLYPEQVSCGPNGESKLGSHSRVSIALRMCLASIS